MPCLFFFSFLGVLSVVTELKVLSCLGILTSFWAREHIESKMHGTSDLFSAELIDKEHIL